MSLEKSDRLAQLFPFLRKAEGDLLDDVEGSCRQVTLPSGQFVSMAGDRCEALPLVVGGSVRVYAMSEAGRETVLYRIVGGESCILTAGCLLCDSDFPAFAKTETEVEVLLVPRPVFRTWFATCPSWSGYVLSLTSRRLAETVTRINDLLYRPLEAKLAEFILEQAGERLCLTRTHAEIAAEIGAARESVSRCLKELERDRLLRSERGSVSVVDAEGLRLRAEQKPRQKPRQSP